MSTNRSRSLMTPARLSVPATALVTALAAAFAARAQTAPPVEPATALPAVTVSDKSNQGDMRPGALRNDIVNTESISAQAMDRAGATNINEALDKHPGISVQVECSICNMRNVLLNNLPGRCTTLMIDGVPIFSAVSSAYGLDSVSVYGAERIDVARGAGRFTVKSRIDIVNEKRGGGALGTDYAAIKASNSGNPFDWSRGPNGSHSAGGWVNPADGTLLPYDGDRGGFSEIIFTDRVQFLTSAEQHWGDSRLRLAFGAAQHQQDSFFEQDHGMLDTIRIDRQITQPEVSTDLSYALSYADDRLALTASLHHNRIKNFALLDPGATDPATGDPVTIFTSSTAPVTVQGVDLNLSYLLTAALTATAAMEAFRYRFPAGTLVFARPKAKAYLGMGYEQAGFDLTAKLVWTSTMDLRRFHDDGSGAQNRFNLDGTPKRDKSPGFFTFDLRGEYAVDKTFSVHAGADNVLDHNQADKESFLFVDGDGAPDVAHLWGPSRGRDLYAGAKVSF